MTSSAASDTDSARKRTPGRSGATAVMIASPLPSGRWTSSSTTSGSSSLMIATASCTVPASPTTSTASPSSARTPARKSAWSSTSTTRAHLAAASARPRCLRRARSSSSRSRRARPGVPRSTRRARAGRKGRPLGSKPAPRSRTNTETRVVGDLRVDVDLLGAGELRRVRHRLARREHEARSSDGQSPAAGDLDRARRAAPRRRWPLRRALQRASSGRRPAGSSYSQPRRSRSCRRARAATRAGLLRMPLDERERLKDGVVHARGDLRALLGSDAGLALRVALDREAPQPRAGDHEQRTGHYAGCERGRTRVASGEDEDDAEGCEGDADRRRRRVGTHAAAAPDEYEADRDTSDAGDCARREPEGGEEQ